MTQPVRAQDDVEVKNIFLCNFITYFIYHPLRDLSDGLFSFFYQYFVPTERFPAASIYNYSSLSLESKIGDNIKIPLGIL
jgi:hypothetical protein